MMNNPYFFKGNSYIKSSGSTVTFSNSARSRTVTFSNSLQIVNCYFFKHSSVVIYSFFKQSQTKDYNPATFSSRCKSQTTTCYLFQAVASHSLTVLLFQELRPSSVLLFQDLKHLTALLFQELKHLTALLFQELSQESLSNDIYINSCSVPPTCMLLNTEACSP